VNETSDEFDTAFASLGTEIGKLSRQSGRHRTVLIITAISIFIDIMLSFVIWQVAQDAKNAASDAASAKHATVLLCQAGVQARQQQADGWDKLIALSNQIGPVKTLTPEEQARQDKLLVGFNAYLDTLRVPRNCNKPSSFITTSTTTTSIMTKR
jgi:hypothetical protein